MAALRTLAALAGALLLVMFTTAAGSPAATPGTTRGAEVVKTGWWWTVNDTSLDETSAAPPQPSAPNVPKGALPVSAVAGEPEKISAIEFRLDAEPGAYAETATLVLKENAEPGATVNQESATIVACPVTDSFWADGAAASWKARPAYDCDLASAAGERDEGGVWTFDLTAVASVWLSQTHQGSTSVVLVGAAEPVEGGTPPEGFQVSFDGPAAKGIGTSFTFGDAPDDEAPLPTGGTGSVGGGASAASGSGSTGSVPTAPLSGTEPGAVAEAMTSASLGSPGEVVPPGTAPSAGEAAAAAPSAQASLAETAPVAASTAVPWYSGIPRGGFLLVPLAIGLAYLLMLALGPEAQPAGGPAQHGVSRALDRLRQAGAQMRDQAGGLAKTRHHVRRSS